MGWRGEGEGGTKFVVLLMFQILRRNDVLTIPYCKYDFRFEIRVSKFMCILNSTHNVEYRLRYCNVVQKCVIFDYQPKQ